jgi:hypothetical protein
MAIAITAVAALRGHARVIGPPPAAHQAGMSVGDEPLHTPPIPLTRTLLGQRRCIMLACCSDRLVHGV